MPFNAVLQYMDAEKLNALKGIFDIVCQESAIPANAKDERDDLARAIIDASEITDSDLVLLQVARQFTLNRSRKVA